MPSPRPLLLALCAAHAAACAPSVNLRPGAQPPRYAAGLRELTLEDGARVRRLNAALWYPAPPASDVRAFRPMPIFQPLAVARDAPPAPGAPRPLVVVSAGGYGTRYSQGWLAAALAEDGYLVLTLDHPGSRRGELTSAGLHRQGDRARDVSFALTHLLGHAEWGPRIAPERIGFAGHSFGGITGVLLAGGRYDAAAQRAACADSADRFCELLRQLDPGPVQDDPDTASLRDERFLAHFLMATSPAEGVVPPPAGPALHFASALADELAPHARHAGPLVARTPACTESRHAAGHFAFVPRCSALGAVLVRELCRDAGEEPRAQTHLDIIRLARAFFDAHLGGPEVQR